MVYLHQRNNKNSIWKWSGVHLKNFASPKKLEKSIKTIKIKKKKLSRGIALGNTFTKFDADWKIFRYRNDDTASATHTNWSQNHTNHRHTSYWSFRSSGGLKSPKKSSSSIKEKNIVCSDTMILSLRTYNKMKC